VDYLQDVVVYQNKTNNQPWNGRFRRYITKTVPRGPILIFILSFADGFCQDWQSNKLSQFLKVWSTLVMQCGLFTRCSCVPKQN
jgi:hypothetical protein